jgi:tetratricopeptide (TPR) repeat protein
MASALPDDRSALAGIREALASGRFDRAAEDCDRFLATHPASADGLALMGEVAYRRGDPRAATRWLESALAQDRRHVRAHWLAGNAWHDLGELDRAIASYRRALRAAPRFAEAHNDLGAAYHAKGWYLEAEQCYRRALELAPDSIAAVENLATTLRALGKISEARDMFVRTLKLRVFAGLRRFFGRRLVAGRQEGDLGAEVRESDSFGEARKLIAGGHNAAAESLLRARTAANGGNPVFHYLLGVALLNQRRSAAAIEYLRRAAELHSSEPEYHIALGNALTSEQQFVEAVQCFQAALALDPTNARALASIARALQERGHYREADEVFRLSLKEDPDLATAHSNRATTLLALGKYAEAEAAARKGLELNPKSVHAMIALGGALWEQRRVDECDATYASAEAIDPDHPQLLNALGWIAMISKGDLARAQSYLERARAVAPDSPNNHVLLARVLLMQQRFAEGWDEYEWRKRSPSRSDVYTKFPYPYWNAEPLENKTIVVNGEQGLGDEIMFASCLPEIASIAGRCILYCERRLEPLFRRSFPSAEVHGGSHLPSLEDPFPILDGVDFQVAAGSLPRLYRRHASDFPPHRGYLNADREKADKWRKRLATLGPGMKVGLSWKGGTPLTDQTRRTLTLEELEPVLRVAGIHWVSLQFGDCKAELADRAKRLGTPIHHWQDAVDDLDETAALICALDLRISVCNTQVHLCGGLGREVWVLAPLMPDWRYGYEGERMLWYPAARMFRQSRARDWAAVLERLKDELALRQAKHARTADSGPS